MRVGVGGGGVGQGAGGASQRQTAVQTSRSRVGAGAGAGPGARRGAGVNAVRALPLSQVDAFLFGSVPLKTYLPDGDIDVALVQRSGASRRETWAPTLAASLERAAADPACPFVVRDVTIVHAEVRASGACGGGEEAARAEGACVHHPPTPVHSRSACSSASSTTAWSTSHSTL